MGQIRSGDGCVGVIVRTACSDAVKYAEEQRGWRLPTVEELESLVNRGCAKPAINQTEFPNMGRSGWYRSATPGEGFVNLFWDVAFAGGDVTVSNRDNDGAVRLVRADPPH